MLSAGRTSSIDLLEKIDKVHASRGVHDDRSVKNLVVDLVRMDIGPHILTMYAEDVDHRDVESVVAEIPLIKAWLHHSNDTVLHSPQKVERIDQRLGGRYRLASCHTVDTLTSCYLHRFRTFLVSSHYTRTSINIFRGKIVDFFDILAILPCTFRGGAMVAQLAVNELVVGSNPTRGAK
jgi:hypothetical protein